MLSLERTKISVALTVPAKCKVQRIPLALVPAFLQKIQFQVRKYFRSGEVCLPATVSVHLGDCYALFISSAA